jgi:hypothetical protein
MKRLTMMMVAAGIATLGSTAARAQAPGPGAPAPTPMPATIPDNATPYSAQTPMQPGTVPPLATADSLPPPASPPRPIVTPVTPPNPYAVESATGYPAWVAKMGSAIMLGGGFEDFTQGVPKSFTSGGGSWDLRLTAGTRQFVGLEAAYVGAAHSANVLGSTSSTLISNGLEGNFRVNVPIAAGQTLLEPFGVVGIGWQHYQFSRTITTADLTTTDNVMTVPYGAGFMAAYRMLMVDARVTFRETYFNHMFPVTNSKLNTWGVGGNIGVEF